MDSQESPSTGSVRLERDSLGERELPADAYWGISTLRAVENFPVSGRTIGSMRSLLWGFGAIKAAAARTNEKLGLLEPARSAAMQAASLEVMDGLLDEHFVVDRIQGGAGTSTNMNVNEVVANRGLELLGLAKGDYAALHPMDDVNRSQSPKTPTRRPSRSLCNVSWSLCATNMSDSATLSQLRPLSSRTSSRWDGPSCRMLCR